MSGKVYCSVVLPAYREAENLQVLLPQIQAALEKTGQPCEIIVVDLPQSVDETPTLCATFGSRYVNRQPSTSFGDAVRTGIREARGDWILFIDADGSHSPDFIPELLRHVGDSEVVIASRYVAGGNTENPMLLILMSRILNISYALILGLHVKDVSNSFKVYSAPLLKSLELRCANFDIIEEILFKLKRAWPQARIREIPYTFRKRLHGQTKRNLFLFVVGYAITMLRLRFGAGASRRNSAP